jgi:hypothetical protein
LIVRTDSGVVSISSRHAKPEQPPLVALRLVRPIAGVPVLAGYWLFGPYRLPDEITLAAQAAFIHVSRPTQ